MLAVQNERSAPFLALALKIAKVGAAPQSPLFAGKK
jgi:hypothetical protein